MMGAPQLAGIAAVVLLTAAALSYAQSAGRITPLDGIADVQGLSQTRPQARPSDPGDAHGRSLGVPQDDPGQRRLPPFGAPVPPNLLTPPPVLPFNPNRPLMPAPAAPTPFSGGGRAGR